MKKWSKTGSFLDTLQKLNILLLRLKRIEAGKQIARHKTTANTLLSLTKENDVE